MLNVKSLHPYDGINKLNVCAYARISRDKEELETSLNEQIDFYTTTILSVHRWNFAGMYADDGISGSSIKGRVQFQTMIEKARAGEIDIILVKSISRFARNVIDLLSIIQELRVNGVEVLFEREGLSSLDVKCDSYLTMYAKFAEEEIVSMSKNVNWRNQKDFRDGRYKINASQMLGFRYDENRKVVIDEAGAKWIREIFKRYADGQTPAEIAEFLEENHVKTGVGNPKWSSSSVHAILRNEKYVGDAVMQKFYIEDNLTHRRVTNSGQKDKYYVKDGHEGIVDRSTWDKVQKMISANARKYKIFKGNSQDFVTEYTHFGYCPYCHGNYSAKWNRDVRMLYCGSNRTRKLCKNSESVFVEDLDKIIPIQIKKLKENEPLFKEALLKVFKEDRSETQRNQIKALEGELEALRAKSIKFSRYKDPALDELKAEIKRSISLKAKEKMVIENEIITKMNPQARAKNIITELRNCPDGDSIGEYEFKKLFKRVVIYKRDKLVFIIGSDDMSKLPKKTEPSFSCSYKYKIRKTTFICNFGIYINR
jgi:DNA invertase Pin-like site-specific DNA recombinase